MGPKARAVKFYSTVSDRSEVVHLISKLFSADGGPGSGNHHHAGRPGKVGGSAPGKGNSGKAKSDPVDRNMAINPFFLRENGPESTFTSKREKGDLTALRELQAEIKGLSRFGEEGKKRNEIMNQIKEIQERLAPKDKPETAKKKEENKPESVSENPQSSAVERGDNREDARNAALKRMARAEYDDLDKKCKENRRQKADVYERYRKADQKLQSIAGEMVNAGSKEESEKLDKEYEKVQKERAKAQAEYNNLNNEYYALQGRKQRAIANNFSAEEIKEFISDKQYEIDVMADELGALSDKVRRDRAEYAKAIDELAENPDEATKQKVQALYEDVRYGEEQERFLNQMYGALQDDRQYLTDAYKDIQSAEEARKRRESGLSFEEYDRKKAIETFGTTDDYHEAGWMLSTGEMLNFSGEKGLHRGERGIDHREIGQIYPENGGYSTEGLQRFRNDGNIRIYPEIPGINLCSEKEPTEEQYDAIRELVDRIIDEHSGSGEPAEFCIDLSDEGGDMFGHLEYTNDPDDIDEDTQEISADEVINDLKAWYRDKEITYEFGKPTFFGDSMPSQLVNDGGPGSGNFGHAGRPGKVGGSTPGGGGYRVQNTNGKYEGIQKSKAFASIARQARSASNAKEFVDSLSKEQYEQFVGQYRSLNTKEDIWDYTERVMDLMKKQKPQKQPENKIVDGKDISQSYTGFYATSKYNDPVTGQLVDEEIEDVMSKQGFLGFPKVVTQKEFDKIVSEHPEMPLLYRSYTGATPEQTQVFDEMLEKGEWYVDCSVGGAGHGQGMYCAGVYQQEPLYKWNDPKLDSDFAMMEEMNQAGLCVFTDSKGNGFVTKEKIDPKDDGDLVSGTPYLFVNEDGSRTMIQMDEDSYLWVDMNTGAMIPDDKMNEIIMRAKGAYELKYQDLGIYKDAYDKERKEGIKRALNEMEHYRALGIRRVNEETVPDPPEGKERVSFLDNHYYYDMKDMAAFEDKKPQDGDIIAIMNPRNMSDFEKHGASLWMVHGDHLINTDGSEPHTFVLTFDEVEPYETWAKVEGKCEEPNVNPTPSTRLMTLDPSAKIITSSDLREIKFKGDRIRREFREKQEKELQDYLSDRSFDDAWCESNLYYVMMGKGVGNKTDEQIKKIAAYKKSNPERMEKLQAFVDKQLNDATEMKKEASKYDRLQHMDDGIVAALLGYDALNAEGHGQSDSYTVVLNRTKLIISEQRVDVRK